MQVSIRMASAADAAALRAIYAPYVEKTAVSFEYTVPAAETFAQRIKAVLRRYPYLVAEMQGEPVGYAYAGPFQQRAAYDWAAETSVYVREDCRGKGIGRRLYTALEEALRQQGIANAYACVAFPPEEDPYLTRDSVAFHEQMGYRLVGRFHQCGYKFYRWYDMVWMEKFIGPHPERPERPFTP